MFKAMNKLSTENVERSTW